MRLIRHGHWWRDDGGMGDSARNDGWDDAGGGGSDRHRRLGVWGGRKLTTGKLKYRV